MLTRHFWYAIVIGAFWVMNYTQSNASEGSDTFIAIPDSLEAFKEAYCIAPDPNPKNVKYLDAVAFQKLLKANKDKLDIAPLNYYISVFDEQVSNQIGSIKPNLRRKGKPSPTIEEGKKDEYNIPLIKLNSPKIDCRYFEGVGYIKYKIQEHIRLRGYPDQISTPSQYYSENNTEVSAYDAQTGLGFSYGYTGTDSTKKFSYIGTIGLSLSFKTPPDKKFNDRCSKFNQCPEFDWDVTPYFAIDDESSVKPGAPAKGSSVPGPDTATYTNKTQDFGVDLSFLFRNYSLYVSNDKSISKNSKDYYDSAYSFRVDVRPDYQIDTLHSDEIESVAFRLEPIGPLLNEAKPFADFIKLLSPPAQPSDEDTDKNDDVYYTKPDDSTKIALLADARMDFGHYSSVGNTNSTLAPSDYARFGGRVGGLIQPIIFGYKITAASYYIDLFSAAGTNKNIAEVVDTIDLPIKNFGVDLLFSYRNGRREDNGQRDEAVKLGLTAKF